MKSFSKRHRRFANLLESLPFDELIDLNGWSIRIRSAKLLETEEGWGTAYHPPQITGVEVEFEAQKVVSEVLVELGIVFFYALEKESPSEEGELQVSDFDVVSMTPPDVLVHYSNVEEPLEDCVQFAIEDLIENGLGEKVLKTIPKITRQFYDKLRASKKRQSGRPMSRRSREWRD